MSLIPVSKNILVNSDKISYIEQKKNGTTIVCVEGEEFEYDYPEVPVQHFINTIRESQKKQFTAA